jgi:hypothetical protein
LNNVAEEFMLLSNHNVKNVFGALKGLSTSATSLVKSEFKANGYPEGFVTIPDCLDQFSSARNTTGALVISYMPRVDFNDRDLWLQYAEEHKGWIAEANGVTTDEVSLPPKIWEYYDGDSRRRDLESCSARRRLEDVEVKAPSNETDAPFFPVWTISPPPEADAEIINYNLKDRPVFNRAVDFVSTTRRPAFLDVCDQSAWFGVSTNKDILQTVVAFPVFDDFEEDSELAGMFAAIVPWTRFFGGILSDGTEPIDLVVSNTCDEVFTFQIDGTKATFMGEENLHDKRFDALVIQGPFADDFNPSEDEYGLLTESKHCIYTMSVYPTASFEVQYKSMEPLYYALCIVAIFMFTSLAFMVFDCLVTRRQRALVSTARKQNALVSSLFPQSVKQKLMEQGKSVGKHGLRSYLNQETVKTSEEAPSTPM